MSCCLPQRTKISQVLLASYLTSLTFNLLLLPEHRPAACQHCAGLLAQLAQGEALHKPELCQRGPLPLSIS